MGGSKEPSYGTRENILTHKTGPMVLLHVCCAPDGTVPWRSLLQEGLPVMGFFYGSNIHPAGEYEKRKNAFLKLAEALGAPFSLEPYEPYLWIEKTRTLASEKEGGARCRQCFEMQLRASARTALLHGCTCLCTTLTISPHKDPSLINSIGRRVSMEYGLQWIERVWRKNSGFIASIKESHRLDLYRQHYCGCCYSVRRR